jgi:hypothetical protein
LTCAVLLHGVAPGQSTITGEQKQWHETTLTFSGPNTSETAGTNPFLDYRLDVTFTQSGESYVVPGYYAANGDAGNTGASAGNKWRVHFSPPRGVVTRPRRAN